MKTSVCEREERTSVLSKFKTLGRVPMKQELSQLGSPFSEPRYGQPPQHIFMP
jgi:hypothetical protein